MKKLLALVLALMMALSVVSFVSLHYDASYQDRS